MPQQQRISFPLKILSVTLPILIVLLLLIAGPSSIIFRKPESSTYTTRQTIVWIFWQKRVLTPPWAFLFTPIPTLVFCTSFQQILGQQFIPDFVIYFTLYLVGWIIGRMEKKGRKIGWKTMFFTVWQKKENAKDGKHGRKFSLPSPQFTSSQIGRKIMQRKVLSPWNYTNALSHLPSSQTQQLFWNQVKKKKKNRERELEKKKNESTSWNVLE